MATLLVCGNTLRIFPSSFRGIAEEPIAEYDLNDVTLVKYRKGVLGGAFGLLTFSVGDSLYQLTQSSHAEVLADVLKNSGSNSTQ